MTDNNRRVAISYCNQCRFVLRATWLAQELLMTFGEDITELALIPGHGGIFEVRVGDECVFSRQDQGRFPDSKELKQIVRDLVAPGRSLGHSDHDAD